MPTSDRPSKFNPALLVVDMQEDFCPPNGSLAVGNGRDVIPVINTLLANPAFTTRIATKDWHPSTHISFASNHPAPNNVPFTSYTTITNPHNPSETYKTRLWPDHCVQGTKGAELVPELDQSLIDEIVEKGTDDRVEMYSCFHDPFEHPRVSDSGLVEGLQKKDVTHVYVVGLAMDYCVKYSAIDAKKAGFEVYVVEEGTKAVDPSAWEEVRKELEGYGIVMVGTGGGEMGWLDGKHRLT
ncbi:NAD(+) salvage pathway protein [Orbilia oligospora]|uniref:nicotinamidase n=1 Tax=Orbilia oligospora TaxID=2813651 RepID=A0A7C8K7V2_ORBOL|nr:NAD(+) salvage pathway protein [Orbilia oligospora]KAF3183134.1 NAD(+) salvage pathway protein [Orbilia oligospora]KAF3234509.1 NAD(+) salvage pathway protein [Orbilia oligospora]KAF3251136.1 NAD(+) salvage pathway protein [Orbilia oligospora]KAF3298479.1 NAD(+) salvage pathway protein [Orbilia oligospora]